MVLKGLITGLAVSLAGLFGCTKHAAQTAAPRDLPAADSREKDLGVVQLTNHYETCVAFGPGRDCRIVPKVIDRHNVELTLTVESKGPDGKISGFSVVQLMGNEEQPFQISIGGTNFSFTPQIAEAD